MGINDHVLHPMPSCVREGNITWNAEEACWIGALAAWALNRFYLETIEANEQQITNKYFELTDTVLVPTPGLFNIASSKYGTEANIYFEYREGMPKWIATQQEKPGQLNRVDLFWALIRLGFRIGQAPDIVTIRANVPETFRANFDKGANPLAYTPMETLLT